MYLPTLQRWPYTLRDEDEFGAALQLQTKTPARAPCPPLSWMGQSSKLCPCITCPLAHMCLGSPRWLTGVLRSPHANFWSWCSVASRASSRCIAQCCMEAHRSEENCNLGLNWFLYTPSPSLAPKQRAEHIFTQGMQCQLKCYLTEGSSMTEHKNTQRTQKQTEVNVKTKLSICSKNQLSNA